LGTGSGFLVVTGTGFASASAVYFGAVASPDFGPARVLSDNAVEVHAPGQAAGVVDVTVTTLGGTSGVVPADRFSYVTPPAPVVSGLSLTSCSTLGIGNGFLVITGGGFAGASAVYFGAVPASDFGPLSVLSDNAIEVHAPGQAAGVVDVTVVRAGVTSATSPASKFTYFVPPTPTVSALSQSSGHTLGGYVFAIAGSGFSGATAVQFGTARSTAYWVVSDNCIKVTAPPNALGVVDVTVVGPGGTSATTAADQFTYVLPPPPTVVAVSPPQAPAGADVFLLGSNFAGVTGVTFGGVAATAFYVRNGSDKIIQVTAPPGG
jgi:hypothetical protein